MRTTLSLILLGLLGGGGCQSTVCGEGTIERNGTCEPPDTTTTNAACGPFTTLEGNVCVPQFDPTMCDPATTTPMVDPDTGVTTCIGTGGGGCDATFACPNPSDSSHQTICGQIYDLESGTKFQAMNATGAPCTATTPDGPCAMGVVAYDAFDFATNPATAQPLQTGKVYLDDCGRYRVPDITTPPDSPYVGLGFDDADSSKIGPTGVTNGIGISQTFLPGAATPDIDGWFAPKSTTDKFAMNGGPSLSTGYFVGIYFAGKTGRALQAGITPLHNGNPDPSHDFFFSDSDGKRTTIDNSLTMTGANGTALVTGASVGETFAWGGSGLPSTCKYVPLTEASLPNVVIVQEFRPANNGAMQCPL